MPCWGQISLTNENEIIFTIKAIKREINCVLRCSRHQTRPSSRSFPTHVHSSTGAWPEYDTSGKQVMIYALFIAHVRPSSTSKSKSATLFLLLLSLLLLLQLFLLMSLLLFSLSSCVAVLGLSSLLSTLVL